MNTYPEQHFVNFSVFAREGDVTSLVSAELIEFGDIPGFTPIGVSGNAATIILDNGDFAVISRPASDGDIRALFNGPLPERDASWAFR